MNPKNKHLQEDRIYVISNHSTARNPMFSNQQMQAYFREKMEQYISPIGKIINYCLNDNEFQILVKLGKRKEFESFYRKKKGKKGQKTEEIPDSTYIFSQQMANLQVSFVKHFNWYYGRSGGLIARRFRRQLVESEEQMQYWIQHLNNGKKHHNYSGIWVNDLMKSEWVMTGRWIYAGGDIGDKYELGVYINGYNSDLAGSFKNLIVKTLSTPKYPLHPKKNHQPPPNK